VEHGDGPRQPRREVDHSPHPMADPATNEAGHHHGDEQVEGERPEAEPDRTVGGDEGDDGVEPADRCEAVEDGGRDVGAQKWLREPASLKARVDKWRPAEISCRMGVTA